MDSLSRLCTPKDYTDYIVCAPGAMLGESGGHQRSRQSGPALGAQVRDI